MDESDNNQRDNNHSCRCPVAKEAFGTVVVKEQIVTRYLKNNHISNSNSKNNNNNLLKAL